MVRIVVARGLLVAQIHDYWITCLGMGYQRTLPSYYRDGRYPDSPTLSRKVPSITLYQESATRNVDSIA